MKSLIFAILVLGSQVFAAESMNGYAVHQFGDFTKWHQVTVRYRVDNGEMRFVYANDKAWAALKSGKTYPDGSVFAKMAIVTQDNPLFPSSKVPSGSVRQQLMVRDHRLKDTQGWGYAIFDAHGKPLREKKLTDHEVAVDCAGCHLSAESRQYVFSVPLEAKPFADKVNVLHFEEVDRSALSEALRSKLPDNYTRVRSLAGQIKTHSFVGTLNEIKPVLIKSATASMPAVLDTSVGFSAAVVTGKMCANGSVGGGQEVRLISAQGDRVFDTTTCR